VHNFKLKVNDRVEVINEEKSYKALIMDVQDDFIKINLPVYDGEYLMVHSKEIIEMNSYLEDGGCYNFNAEVISRGKEEIYYIIDYQSPLTLQKYNEEISLG
jgi:c-di-GMP-binding flagellar brake protein YcgR